MKKRLFLTLLVLALVLILVPAAIAADANPVLSGSCGTDATYTLSSDGVLTISGTGMVGSKDPNTDLVPWYNTSLPIVTVRVEEGITHIGYFVFRNLPQLEKVYLPASLVKVDGTNFNYCPKLESIYIPDLAAWCQIEFDTAHDRPFHDILWDLYVNNTKVENLVIPDTITVIKKYAFTSNRSIRTVTLPDGLTTIGHSAFFYCTNLSSINLPNTLTTLESSALSYTGLKTVEIPSSITTLSSYLFDSCEQLLQVNLPANLEKIEAHCFEFCESLQTVTIPDKVTRIDSCAFRGCLDLEEVTMGSGLTYLGEWVFWECSNIKAVNVKDLAAWCAIYFHDSRSNPLSVGEGILFVDGQLVSNLVIPQGVKRVESYAFYKCDCLRSLVLPDGLEFIDYYSFGENPLLNLVTIPESLTYVHRMAFGTDLSSDITHILYKGTEEQFNKIDGKDHLLLNDRGITVHYSASGNEVTGQSYFAGTKYFCSLCNKEIKEASLLSSLTLVQEPAKLTYTAGEPLDLTGGKVELHRIDGQTQIIDLTADMISSYEPDAVGRQYVGIMYFKQSDGFNVRVKKAHIHTPADPVRENEVPATTDHEGFYDLVVYCSGCGEELIRKSVTVPRLPFKDIPENAFFAKPVSWAVGMGIAQGMTENSFMPMRTCNRGQIVTFLWRAMGCPKPSATDSPFTDVKPGSFCYDAVLWANEVGVTNGMTKTTFGTEMSCTRGQVVTFLWRALGSPKPASADNPFTDVPQNRFYYTPVLWASQAKITDGMTPTEFWPESTCTRGQIVTFLYRAFPNG